MCEPDATGVALRAVWRPQQFQQLLINAKP
jgi:hypothetical protein